MFRYPRDHFESTRMIGEKQAEAATKFFQEAQVQVHGKISFKQTFVNFSRLSVGLPSGEIVSTCPAAVGFGFAAGTSDGPGAFDFTQGDKQVHHIYSYRKRVTYIPSCLIFLIFLPNDAQNAEFVVIYCAGFTFRKPYSRSRLLRFFVTCREIFFGDW